MSADDIQAKATETAWPHAGTDLAEPTAAQSKSEPSPSTSTVAGDAEPTLREAEARLNAAGSGSDKRGADVTESGAREATRPRLRIVPALITLAAVAIAASLGWAMWDSYLGTPWTRDGTVRVYVVAMAPEVAGRIVELRVVDNQFVHKGDVLMVIDPTDFRINLRLAEAAVAQAEANMINADRLAEHRMALSPLAVSKETQQTFETQAAVARAQYQQALANRDQAKANLERTTIRSPVNGWVTNLLARVGDYATVGALKISIVDADSFWIDGYFTETNLHAIHEGDPVKIKLMGYRPILNGRVASIARGINVANAQPNQQGVANVNPIFTWVRLAQRVPVRIHIDRVPDGVSLVAGMTATVQVEPRPRPAGK
jgi:RND family efflux transporter MFP subunit